MQKHQLQKIYDWFLSQLISELFRQIKGNSPFNFLETFLVPKGINTKRKDEQLTPTQYSLTKLKLRSLKISIFTMYDWLQSANLVRYDFKNFCRYHIKKNLTSLNQNYIADSQDLFHPF